MTSMAREVRRRYGTIKRFAAVIGVSASQASLICQGRTFAVMQPSEVRALSYALNRTFEETATLLATSYHEWSGESIYTNSAVKVGYYPEKEA